MTRPGLDRRISGTVSARRVARRRERAIHISLRWRRQRPLVLESLEARVLLSASSTESDGVWPACPVPESSAAFEITALETPGRPIRAGNREIDCWGNVAYLAPVPGLRFAPSTDDPATAGAAVPAAASFSPEDTFFLHSFPSATKTIYLDFDGHVTSGTRWNTRYNGGETIVTPPFSLDGDASFSDAELTRIQAIWERVAEDFRPFEVNVTTQDPGTEALRQFGAGDTQWGIRVVIGGSSTDWYSVYAAGGVAYLDSFNWDSDTPAFVFSDNLGKGHEKYVAEAITHEVGHTLGLHHDGASGGTEYYEGHGSGPTGWAPIMGNAYYLELTQWSKGEYPDANNLEDDLAIITTRNGFGYRPDDHGDTHATATPLNPSGGTWLAAEGIIERNTDVDFFSFMTGAGGVELNIVPFHRSPNLDVLATLYDSAGDVIATSNPLDRLDASFDLDLAAGNYYLSVEGVGKEPWSTGYSDYGSLGYYSITGMVPSKEDDWPEISAGWHILLPDTPNQIVRVAVADPFSVSGLRFHVQIADGGPDAGGSVEGPSFQAVDLIGEPNAPTIFAENHTGQQNVVSLPQVQAWQISTDGGIVSAPGLLATLIVDTTGFWKDPAVTHSWPLQLADTWTGSTHFVREDGSLLPAVITSGAITLNTRPEALDSDVAMLKDTVHTFAVADFGFADADAGDALALVRITSLPSRGSLELDGVHVTLDQEISAAALTAGRLQFRPATAATGSPYATFEFVVHDGMQSSNSAAAMTIHVGPANHPPTADDQWLSILENEAATVTLTGSDPDGDELDFWIVDGPLHGSLTGTAPDLLYTPLAGFRGTDSFTYVSYDGLLASEPATVRICVDAHAQIVSRYVFYNDSAWDGNDPAATSADDAAIAPDKQALLPGQTAALMHYTSYVKGLNGLMIDIAHMAADTVLTAGDFEFLAGNSDDLAGWTAAPAPMSITLRPAAGANGSQRVTLVWDEQDAVRNQWLQVTVKATANTNLVQDDVFYFGNAIGESGQGNTDGSLPPQPLSYFPVNVTDEIGTRHRAQSFVDPAPLDDPFDFDRDRSVDEADEIIARAHGTTFRTALRRVAPPPAQPDETSPVEEQGAAGPLIVVGTHVLQPDTPGQVISVYVSGELPVAGLNFNLQIGYVELSSAQTPSAPRVEAVDILTGTIFADNHTDLRVDASQQGGQAPVPQHGYQATTTAAGTVPANGLLATVTIDTTGFLRGSWSLMLSNTVNGPTDFAGQAATVIDGQLVLAETWRNPLNPFDVDGDGRVFPLDALIVISYINLLGGASQLPVMPEAPPPYYDVNGDGYSTAADVLAIVNYINGREAPAAGEAEGHLPEDVTTSDFFVPVQDPAPLGRAAGESFARRRSQQLSVEPARSAAFRRFSVWCVAPEPPEGGTTNTSKADELESILTDILADVDNQPAPAVPGRC